MIAGDCPSTTLVVNGGEITWQDVAYSIKEGRPTLILAGSGRTADRLVLVDLNQPSNQLKEALQTSFRERGSAK